MLFNWRIIFYGRLERDNLYASITSNCMKRSSLQSRIKKWDIKLKVRQIWNNLIIKWLTQKNSYPSPRFESGFWLPTTKPRRWEHITNNNCENFLFTHQPWLMFNREKFLLRVKKQRPSSQLMYSWWPPKFFFLSPKKYEGFIFKSLSWWFLDTCPPE